MDSNWISVNDSLPEVGTKVAVARWDAIAQKYVWDIDRYIADGKTGERRWAGDGRFGEAEVKFWFPLPPLPNS